MANARGPFPTQILADRPMVDARGVATPWFGQLMQLLLSYLGSPGSGTGSGSGSGSTITQQISDIMTSLAAASLGGLDGASQARLIALESAPRPLLPRPAPPPTIPPLPPFPGGGVVAGNEGTTTYVFDTSASSGANLVFRGLQAGPGLAVYYSADTKSIIIALYTEAGLTSGGVAVTSGGAPLTSGVISI